jgi:hypothetical protein
MTCRVPKASSVVDLYRMPTYDDLASLCLEDQHWVIHYTFPPDSVETRSLGEMQALPLSEATINQVLDAITAHAAASV